VVLPDVLAMQLSLRGAMQMSRPWMALWIGDYLKDTGHLRAADHGAYLLLIMHYWTTGGLPNNDGQLARVARMTQDEWQEARPVIHAFFTEGWRHKRIDQELADVERLSALGRTAGLASAAAKNAAKSTGVNGSPTDRQRNVNGSPTEPQPSPSPSHIKKDARARASVNLDLKEGKQAADGQVHVEIDTPQWTAWQAYLKRTTGRGSPQDKSFGWSFPSLWPPGYEARP
jgi:uncharacterized protein YdaU (DUF1376 family)